MTKATVAKRLKQLANPTRAHFSQKFFKTYDGGYAEGDKFLGLTVPAQRMVAKEYRDLPLGEIKELLESEIHEHRFTALEILVLQYEGSPESTKQKIVAFYLKNAKSVNNWDLVDTSAPYILGDWLIHHDRSVLYKLVKSKTIWDRRIAIVATQALIRANDIKDTLELARILLHDEHDLIHKAAGWMLREVGKKSLPALTKFLDHHAKVMPRTMLRYAIEKLPKNKRSYYLSAKSLLL
jgi:3-methyladenine DNA glycosylase AlkD